MMKIEHCFEMIFAINGQDFRFDLSQLNLDSDN